MICNSMQDTAVFSNLFYSIEGHNYPKCILGGDRFLDWFSRKTPLIQLTTDYTFEMMKLSYELGVRGFDISCRFNLIEAFKKLKNLYPDVIGIGNPNWLCGYKLKNDHLWHIKDRILLTIVNKLNQKNISLDKFLDTIPENHRSRFNFSKDTFPLTDDEIQQIYIDKDIWLNRINSIKEITDFCLIGSDYGDWMCGLNRLDLIRWQIESVRKSGIIPISVSHWISLTIPLFDKEDFGAHWVYANNLINLIRPALKPITAFKILSNIKLPDEIESRIYALKNIGVKSYVVGIENQEQAKSTLPRVMSALS